MKSSSFLLLACLGLLACRLNKVTTAPAPTVFAADNPLIQYMGRVDFSDRKKPTFWASGVTVKARFTGPACALIVGDEVPGGTSHNYIEIVIDDQKPVRFELKAKIDTLTVASGLSAGEHTVTLCKNTESGIGCLQFRGIRCQQLLALPPEPGRKIEFIGNSITCGTGMDLSEVPCGTGKWQDQHNAYMAYGPRLARQLNAQYHLTAVSGIGLIHSCCNLTISMPDVFDKVNQRANAVPWDFNRYTPDVVTVCLGQNDGIQDSTAFCRAYVQFIGTIRSHYPLARIICLTSPMADAKLVTIMKRYLTGIVAHLHTLGDAKVSSFFFARSYNSGCDKHPDMAEHALIANELEPYLKQEMSW